MIEFRSNVGDNLRSQHGVHGIRAPASGRLHRTEQREDGPDEGPNPGEDDHHDRFLEGQRFANHSFDDDVVAVPRNHSQRGDLAVSEERSCCKEFVSTQTNGNLE